MGTRIRISGVQMLVSKNIAENLSRYLANIEAAAGDGADICVLFPECSLSGYHGGFDDAQLATALDAVLMAIKKHKIATIVGTGWRKNGSTHIQTRAYENDGTLLGTHEKMVPTGRDGVSGDRSWCVPGKELRTFAFRGVTCGMLICNDLWVTPSPGDADHPDPRLVTQLAAKGAKLIFHAINSGTGPGHHHWHESNLALRAEAGGVVIATANAADNKRPINCSSGVMGLKLEWLTKVDRLGEGRYLATVEID